MELINKDNYYSYGSQDQGIVIGFELLDDKIILDNMQYQPHSIKLFLVFLKTAITKLIEKNKYNKMVQHVLKYDWDTYLFKDADWSLLETYEQDGHSLCIIECDLNKSIDCIARGLGVYEHGTNYETIID